EQFRRRAFDLLCAKHGAPRVCVPAAAVTRDQLAVKIDKVTGKPIIYPVENFRLLTEGNLVAPVYWAMEMVARIPEERKAQGPLRWEPEEGIQGTVIFIGSISSQGIPGQIAYAATKAALEERPRPSARRRCITASAAPSSIPGSPIPGWSRPWVKST